MAGHIKLDFFDMDNMRCPCCKRLDVDSESALMLDEARRIANIPFIITSACRCWNHNEKVGGVDCSAHCIDTRDGGEKSCTAFDIKALTSFTRMRVVSGLIAAGFRRIGIAESFVHCDNDSEKPSEVCWLY